MFCRSVYSVFILYNLGTGTSTISVLAKQIRIAGRLPN